MSTSNNPIASPKEQQLQVKPEMKAEDVMADPPSNYGNLSNVMTNDDTVTPQITRSQPLQTPTISTATGVTMASPVLPSNAITTALRNIETTPVEDDPRAWSSGRKLTILSIISFAALAPTTGAFIYQPSIQRIEKELHATTNQIALSLSLFILVQGNAPLLWSSISEIKGRKFVYVLAIFIFILGSAIGGISNNISLLIFMRMFQAAGSSAVLALGAGTLADIYAPHERGTMMGIYYAAPLLGPSVGPLIGGVLTQVFTWRATFYFLATIGAIVFLSIVFFFKDTFRRERSLTYQSAKRHAIRRLEEKRQKSEEKEKRIAERKGEEDKLEKGGAQSQMKEVTNTRDESTVKVTLIDLNPLTPIWSVLKRKNNLTILIPSAILFAVQYSVCFTTARTFAASPYNYDPLKIGLVLLSFGLGNVLGSVLGGKWSDLKLHELKTVNGGKGWAEMRLESTKLVMILLPPAILAFGWTCQEHTHIVGPVITLFISGFSVLFIYSSTLAYIVDANSGRSTTAVASNSSFRGLSGFVASEIAAPLQDSLGDGGLYSIWAGLLVITELMILLVIWKGKTWREEAEKHEKFLGGLGVDSNEGTRQVSSGSTTPALDGVAAPIRRNVTSSSAI